MPAPHPIWISLQGEMPPTKRTLDARIFLRFPAAYRALSRVTFWLPRRSRLRQAILRRSVLRTMGAWSRGDFALAPIGVAPDYVLTVEARTDRARLDFEPSYRGPDGLRDFMRTAHDAFGDHSYEPQWLVDLGGDTIVMLLKNRLRGRASGVGVEQVSAHRWQVRSGLLVREELHAATGDQWEPVLRGVGLDPAELPQR